MYKLPSNDNAPTYRYHGYRYVPNVEDYHNEDGTLDCRKIWHDVYYVEDYDINKGIRHEAVPDFTINHSPYKFLTYDEFKYYVSLFIL